MIALIVKKQVKECANDMSVSPNFLDALDRQVQDAIERARHRAQANGRRTLMEQDL